MKNKLIRVNLVLLVLLTHSLIVAQYKNINEELRHYSKDLPFEMGKVVAPEFHEQDFNIIDYGAVGDGIVKNTMAFEKAISDCNSKGGGKVIVPKGIWLTGPITLLNNVNLHLEQGAHILFTKNFDDYPLILTSYEGRPQYRCTSPINAKNQNNIAITGFGIIDGNGDAWRYVKRYKLTDDRWRDLKKSGVTDKGEKNWWPSEQALDAEKYMKDLGKNISELSLDEAKNIRDYLRPVMVSLISCSNILLEGVTFQNSPAWNLHPLMCENMIIKNITVRNPWYSQNGDGIDIESCKNVYLFNSNFDVGDDAICMKSGRDQYGRDRGMPSENIVIADCIVYHAHGGFTIGSEMSGGVRNVKVSNCNFIGTDVGLRFKSTRGRGGVVENIFIDNIFMKDIPTNAISFNMFYDNKAPTEASSAEEESNSAAAVPVTEETPVFRKIYLENIICTGAETSVILQGLPEMPISDIRLYNINMISEKGISIFDANAITISNAVLGSASEPLIKVINGSKIEMNKILNLHNAVLLSLSGFRTSNITISDTELEDPATQIKVGEGLSKEIFKIIK